ncbi:MAG: amidohydrolase [Xanthomonadales bacterium]|nr:amidohydrolase [Xanthomonadales bacterium]
MTCCLGIVGCEQRPGGEGGIRSVSEPGISLISNARIYTFDPGDTVIDMGAMAFSAEGEIVALGDHVAMLAAYPEARRIDLKGRTVLPGLIDSHGHLYGLAQSFTRADLVGTRSKQEVLERLRAFAAGLEDDEWLLGRGWDQNDWPEPVFPGRADLDAAFPDRPVWLERIDGHAAWGNSRAIAQADRDLSGDWQPEGGLIHRDAAGAATGIFVDGAMALVERAVPPTSTARMDAALSQAGQLLASLGLTGVHDPGVSRAIVETYREKIADGSLPLRIYALADGPNATLDWLCEHGRYEDASGRLVLRAVKLYADGALGSRGAALLADYGDDPGNRGLLFLSDEGLDAQLRRVMSCGLQAGVHAIGDRANRQVLDAYERLQPEFPDNPGRHRIEHAQIVDPADIPRFAQLGVIAAVQPIHATSDMYWADERLGEARLAGAYAWRSLLDSGATLAFGSDFPVEQVNPLPGIYAAVTRRDLDGWPDGGWQPQERLTRSEAIRAYTLDAARAAFMEDAVGSLEPGKRADFIVLDRDPLAVPEAEIPAVRVLQTWLDGVRVFAL